MKCAVPIPWKIAPYITDGPAKQGDAKDTTLRGTLLLKETTREGSTHTGIVSEMLQDSDE